MTRLGNRLTLVFAALLAAVSVLCVYAVLATARYNMQAVDQVLHKGLAADVVIRYRLTFAEALRQGRGIVAFDDLMAINPNAEFYLLNRDGVILSHRAPEHRVKLDRVDVQPILALIGGAATPVLGEDPREPSVRKVFSAAAVDANDDRHGYLYAVLGGDAYRSAAAMVSTNEGLRLTLAALGASLLAAFVTGTIAFHMIGAKLARLANAMVAFEGAGFRDAPAVPTPSGRGDEIDDLSRVYSHMSARITRQLAEIERADESRRELISHISHDLRTPLATLQAYLETLNIKGATLTEETKSGYLYSAIRSARSIDGLTADLLELATLDLHRAPLRPEPIALAELLHDIAQRFSLAAGGKGVQLTVDPAGPGPTVIGDIGLIERLFANLIDNAVKFTRPGGRVSVGVGGSGDFVSVGVSDTGVGIPEHEIGRIFEGFYRVEHLAPEVSGRGLGLAIAKRIAELHGGRIEVTSAPNIGTTFHVSLPRDAEKAALTPK